MLARGTGIATYARGLGQAVRDAGYATEVLVDTGRKLPRNDPKLAEVVLLDANRRRNLIDEARVESRRIWGAPFGLRAGAIDRLSGAVSAGREQLHAFERIHAIANLVDVERLHFMRYGTRLRVKIDRPCDLFQATRAAPIEVKGAANVYTIHDIVPLRLPNSTTDDKVYFADMVRALSRTADHIVTVSEFSRNDIISFTGMDPSRITNTYQTVAFPEEMVSRTTTVVNEDLRRHYDLEYKDYYLFVGAIEPKKNISRLIDAYAASGARRPLVIAGGLGWMYEADLERINSERFLSYVIKDRTIVPQRRVRRLPYVPLQGVIDLIRGARALLYPSIYEGFGLPAVEGMLLGTPVLTSNVASLPEVTGGAAMLVDPYDIPAMARAISTLDVDDDLLAEMSRRGVEQAARFNPQNATRMIGDLYRSILG